MWPCCLTRNGPNGETSAIAVGAPIRSSREPVCRPDLQQKSATRQQAQRSNPNRFGVHASQIESWAIVLPFSFGESGVSSSKGLKTLSESSDTLNAEKDGLGLPQPHFWVNHVCRFLKISAIESSCDSCWQCRYPTSAWYGTTPLRLLYLPTNVCRRLFQVNFGVGNPIPRIDLTGIRLAETVVFTRSRDRRGTQKKDVMCHSVKSLQ
jgi:hypothetical protein